MANIVKSVEKFDLTLSALTTTSGQLSKSQDIANCVPFMSTRGNSSSMRAHITDAYFSSVGSDNFINVARSYNNGTTYCKIYVVEFDPNEVKVQQGSFTLNGINNTTVTISGVDQDRAAMSFYHVATTGTDNANANLVRGKFASDSSLEFRRGATNQSVNGHYFVFEDLNNQFIVQSSDWSNSSSTDIELNPMSFVKGLLLSSYYSDYGGNIPSYQYAKTFLRSRKNIRIDKFSGSSTVYGTSFFIEFTDNKRHTQQWLSHFSESDTAIQYDLRYPVDLDYSMSILDNFQSIITVNTTNGGYSHNAFCTAELLTASGVEIYRNNSGIVSYANLQVFDWKGVDTFVGNNPNPLASGISCAKSVENNIISITGREFYTDYALTKGQDISNCVPFISSRGDSNNYSKQMYNVWFESPNLVCVNRGDLDATSIIHLNIVEFYPDQVEVNSGAIYISGQYDTTTIPKVDLSKTVLVLNGSLPNNAYPNSSYVRGRFTSASGIEFYRIGTNSNWNGTYYTFEDLKENFEVEQHTGSFSYYSRDYATMELEPACSFLIGSYTSDYGGNIPSYTQARLTYQSTSIAGFNKYSSSSSCYYCYFMVKFIDGRDHVQNIYQYFSSSDSTKTQPLNNRFVGHSDSITAYSNVCPGSEVNTTNGGYTKYGWCSIELLPSNMLEMKLIAAPGVDVKTSFSVIDWVGYKPPPYTKFKTKSFVRSIETVNFTLIDNDYQDIKYLTKGQVPENCVPFYTLKSANSNAATYESMVSCLIFTNTNKVSACRGMYGSGMGRIDMAASIVEFNPDKIKIQRGHFYVSGTSTNITIEEVDLHRAFVVVSSYCYGVSNHYDTSFLEAYFSDSTTLMLRRNSSDGGAIMGQYYVVEALNGEFYVQTIRGNTGSATKSIPYPEYILQSSKSMLIASIRSDYGGNIPSYGCTRIYNDLQSIYTNKYSSSSTIFYTIFVIDFNKSLDIVTQQRFFSFSSSENVKSSSINEVNEKSTALITPTQSINSTVNSTSYSQFPYAFSEIVLTTSGTKVEASLSQAPGTDIRSFVQVVEFPKFNTHYFDGTVTERGLPAAGRIVRAYRRDTGDLMDETVSSSGTGYFYLETTYSGAHDIVCLDDLAGYSYNDLIYGDVLPTVISGAL